MTGICCYTAAAAIHASFGGIGVLLSWNFRKTPLLSSPLNRLLFIGAAPANGAEIHFSTVFYRGPGHYSMLYAMSFHHGNTSHCHSIERVLAVGKMMRGN
jgi:hypothetical protein